MANELMRVGPLDRPAMLQGNGTPKKFAPGKMDALGVESHMGSTAQGSPRPTVNPERRMMM